MRLRVRKLHQDAIIPSYAHEGDAGLDLHSIEDVTLKPGERAAIATGLALEIPVGFAGFVHARSGRALREGLAVVNAPGVVDSGYRGEVKVLAVNLDPDSPIHISKGERVAQLVIQKVEHVQVESADTLEETARGDGGFGSTGV